MINKNLVLDEESVMLMSMLNLKNVNKFIREAIKEKAKKELEQLLIEGYKSTWEKDNAEETGLWENAEAKDHAGEN